MKICYLSDANSAHTKKWCSYFTNKGYDIHVISLNKGVIPGVTVHSFGMDLDKIRKGSTLQKLNYVTYVGKVKKLIKDINPDILHAHYATSYGLLGALSNFHPYIVSVWGSDVYEFPQKGFIQRSLVKHNLTKADVIMSTSNAMAEETKKYTNKNIEITPFGVNIDLFKPYEGRYELKDEFVIGIVKTLEINYGIEYLIRAFSKVSEKCNNVKLLIAGDGSQRYYLEELCKELKIEKKVNFLGLLNVDGVINAFNNIDVAVFPSENESFGVAAVEAQACGTPVIVSNVGGLPEATSPGNSSIVIEKGDIDAIAKSIIKLVEDNDLRICMGKYGRKFIEEIYNIEENFNRVDKIYKRIIKKL